MGIDPFVQKAGKPPYLSGTLPPGLSASCMSVVSLHSGPRMMLILLIVAIALEILAFLLLLPHGLVVAIVGAMVAGAIGIIGTGSVLALMPVGTGCEADLWDRNAKPINTKKCKGRATRVS